jgi:hypothetical protein
MAKRGWRFNHTEGPTTYTDPEYPGERCHTEGIAEICSNY